MNRKTVMMYILLVSAAIILVLCVAPALIAQYQVDARAYPNTDVFYCKELDVNLTFSEESIVLTMPNGSQEDIYAHPAGRFCTEDGRKINMWYSWNKRKDYIEIRVISFPNAIEDEIYRFIQVPNNTGD